jgi:hypothetical protein
LHKSQLAYGYPDKLKRVGDRLLAGFKKISPQFQEWVKNGNILGLSSSFYLPGSPHNPYPGKLALRHISGLGVDPPAVKGMNLAFTEPLAEFPCYAEEQEGTVDFALDADEETIEQAKLGAKLYAALQSVSATAASFGGDSPQLASLFRDFYSRSRDRLIEEKGVEEADKLYPSFVLDQLNAIASQPWQPDVTPDMVAMLAQRIDQLEQKSMPDYQEQEDTTPVTDEVSTAQYSELKAENEQLKASVQFLLQQNKDVQLQRETDRVSAFCETLVRDHKIDLVEKDDEIRFILSLDNTTTADYGEEGQLTPRAKYEAKLANRKPLWTDRRLPINPEDAPTDFSEVAGISLPPGYSVDPESAKTFRKAQEYQKAQNCDFSEAIAAVTRGVY